MRTRFGDTAMWMMVPSGAKNVVVDGPGSRTKSKTAFRWQTSSGHTRRRFQRQGRWGGKPPMKLTEKPFWIAVVLNFIVIVLLLKERFLQELQMGIVTSWNSKTTRHDDWSICSFFLCFGWGNLSHCSSLCRWGASPLRSSKFKKIPFSIWSVRFKFQVSSENNLLLFFRKAEGELVWWHCTHLEGISVFSSMLFLICRHPSPITIFYVFSSVRHSDGLHWRKEISFSSHQYSHRLRLVAIYQRCFNRQFGHEMSQEDTYESASYFIEFSILVLGQQWLGGQSAIAPLRFQPLHPSRKQSAMSTTRI